MTWLLQMHPDSRLMLAFGTVLCVLGAVLVGLAARAWWLHRQRQRSREARLRSANAPTAVYGPQQWAELWDRRGQQRVATVPWRWTR